MALPRRGAQSWRIDPASAGDYRRLLEQLKSRGLAPQAVLHCWSLERRDGSQAEDAATRLADTQLSFIYLAQALDACQCPGALTILALTAQREAVLAGDEVDC